jgi:hypothetical protein
MAFAATLSTKEPRSFSIGPLCCQIYTWGAVSGDTSGTITAAGLKEVFHVIIDGLGKGMSAAPSFSGNVVTLAFADPAATVAGTALVIGRK